MGIYRNFRWEYKSIISFCKNNFILSVKILNVIPFDSAVILFKILTIKIVHIITKQMYNTHRKVLTIAAKK